MSRSAVQPWPSGSLWMSPLRSESIFSIRTPSFDAGSYSDGRFANHAQTRSPARSPHDGSPRSNDFSRSLRWRSGSGIFTGHTTPHWLHIVDAAGRSFAFSSPTYIGVRIDPIGPG